MSGPLFRRRLSPNSMVSSLTGVHRPDPRVRRDKSYRDFLLWSPKRDLHFGEYTDTQEGLRVPMWNSHQGLKALVSETDWQLTLRLRSMVSTMHMPESGVDFGLAIAMFFRSLCLENPDLTVQFYRGDATSGSSDAQQPDHPLSIREQDLTAYSMDDIRHFVTTHLVTAFGGRQWLTTKNMGNRVPHLNFVTFQMADGTGSYNSTSQQFGYSRFYHTPSAVVFRESRLGESMSVEDLMNSIFVVRLDLDWTPTNRYNATSTKTLEQALNLHGRRALVAKVPLHYDDAANAQLWFPLLDEDLCNMFVDENLLSFSTQTQHKMLTSVQTTSVWQYTEQDKPDFVFCGTVRDPEPDVYDRPLSSYELSEDPADRGKGKIYAETIDHRLLGFASEATVNSFRLPTKLLYCPLVGYPLQSIILTRGDKWTNLHKSLPTFPAHLMDVPSA